MNIHSFESDGVRPSSGAATPDLSTASTLFVPTRGSSIAAPGDGRTPRDSASGLRRHERRASFAFTLIELMIAVGLMTLIVLGLLVMFAQTQKAFKASMTQTDVLESGRIFTDMIAREISQASASDRAFVTNFFADLSPSFPQPLLQGMPGTVRGAGQDNRTNMIQRLFFLSQTNQDWLGIGYLVIPDYQNAGVGTLYRFTTNHNNYWATNMSGEFLNAPLTNMSRIADGIVHLRVRAFATNGYPILWDGLRTNAVFRTNTYNNGYLRLQNTIARTAVPDELDCYFLSNALPAYVELEVGILEPHILDRFRAIGGGALGGNPPAQQRYLSNHVAQVHIFRQRIPIRTVDYTAYQ